jgi:hypothetical protein
MLPTAVVYNQTTTIATLNSGATLRPTFPSVTLNTAGSYTIKAKAELGTDTCRPTMKSPAR